MTVDCEHETPLEGQKINEVECHANTNIGRGRHEQERKETERENGKGTEPQFEVLE